MTPRTRQVKDPAEPTWWGRMLQPTKWHRGNAYLYSGGWILLLSFLALAFSMRPRWSWVPTTTLTFTDVLPLWVPWAGMLGGATISMVGVAKHSTQWDGERYGYWHASRPFLGAVSGTVSVLIVVLVTATVKPGTQEATAGAAATYTPTGIGVLTVIAFVVGYREETFRALIRKVVDVILGPSDDSASSTVALVPSAVDFHEQQVGQQAQQTLNLFNGSPDTLKVTNAGITCEGAGLTASIEADADLQPQDSLAVTLSWTPAAAGALSGRVRIALASRELSASVAGTAVAQAQPGSGGATP